MRQQLDGVYETTCYQLGRIDHLVLGSNRLPLEGHHFQTLPESEFTQNPSSVVNSQPPYAL